MYIYDFFSLTSGSRRPQTSCFYAQPLSLKAHPGIQPFTHLVLTPAVSKHPLKTNWCNGPIKLTRSDCVIIRAQPCVRLRFWNLSLSPTISLSVAPLLRATRVAERQEQQLTRQVVRSAL